MRPVQFLRAKPGTAGSKRYFWEPSATLRKAGWQSRRLSNDPATAIAEAEARNAEVAAWRAETGGVDQPRDLVAADSVKAMIIAYQGSRFWRSLATRTQVDYQLYLHRIDQWIGDQPAAAITTPIIESHYENLLQTGKTHAANAYMRVLRLLFSAGRRKGFVIDNPAMGLGLENAGRKVAPIIWTDEHVAAMVETADAMGRHSVGTAIMLNCWLGQRLGDVLAMSRDDCHSGVIGITQSKTGRRVELPVEVVPHLVARIGEEVARLDAGSVVVARIGPGGEMHQRELIVSELSGRRYQRNHFSHVFGEIRAEAVRCHPDVEDLVGLRFAWLRHTAVTKMAEAGSDLAEIATISGHSLKTVAEIIEHYLVRTGKMARSAFLRRLHAAEERHAASGGRRPGTYAADDH